MLTNLTTKAECCSTGKFFIFLLDVISYNIYLHGKLAFVILMITEMGRQIALWQMYIDESYKFPASNEYIISQLLLYKVRGFIDMHSSRCMVAGPLML